MKWQGLLIIGALFTVAGIALTFITICQWLCRRTDETAAENARKHNTPMSTGETTLPYFY